MKYLFKCRNESEDIFFNLYEKMLLAGFDCIRLIDENNSDSNLIDNLKNQEISIITSDHIHIPPKNGYSILELIDILKPKKIFYGIHDLAINDIGYDKKLLPENFILLLPGEPWNSLYKDINKNIVTVGHPKFNKITSNKSGILFAASLIYVYAERPPKSFKNDFKWIFDNNITIKLPDCKLSHKLAKKLNYDNVIISGPTFDIMQNYETVITNSSSSICVEAAICGCKSINIGAKISKIYDKFNITFIKPKDLYNININNIKSMTFTEYLFDINKAVSILMRYTT